MRRTSRLALLVFGTSGCTRLLGIDGDYRAQAAATSDSSAPLDGANVATDGGAESSPDGGEVVKVVAGRFHSCALFASGRSKCWGRNDDFGELGDGTFVSSAVPVGAMGTASADLFAGAHGTCAALFGSGGGVCAGRGDDGQLGDGLGAGSSVPVIASALAAPPIAFAMGETFACALVSSGDVYCFGAGMHGELGNGTFGVSASPVAVVGLGQKATAIAAFYEHACALLADGRVACWGADSSGQLGDAKVASDAGSALPSVVAGVAGASAIGVGEAHSCALVAGAVQCWGANESGQLGDGTGAPSAVPVVVTGVRGAGSLAVGGRHACAGLLSSGGVMCWGKGGSGQLGSGGSRDQLAPVTVSGVGGYPLSLSAGGFHTCALLASPVVQCWGSNDFGQLGDGTVAEKAVPTAVQW